MQREGLDSRLHGNDGEVFGAFLKIQFFFCVDLNIGSSPSVMISPGDGLY